MKVIIPLAGWGTRVRPHTYTKPKSLIDVAGKPVLAHILDELAGLCVEEIIFITGQMGDQIKQYVTQHYSQYRTRYLHQAVMSGQSPAVYLAKDFVQDDLLIIFSDTVFRTDLATLAEVSGDGVLHVKGVKDPARFGVAVLDETGRVIRLVEKPQVPVSNLAVVGVYYFKNARNLFRAIETQLSHNETRLGGEYYLADAIELMIKEGAVFRAREIELWEDCGTIPALLETNRRLLALQIAEKGSEELVVGEVINSVVIPPVYIGPGSRVVNSVIGPHVSVSGEVEIRNCIIKESLIGDQASLSGVNLACSIVGSRTRVVKAATQLNISDNSAVIEL